MKSRLGLKNGHTRIRIGMPKNYYQLKTKIMYSKLNFSTGQLCLVSKSFEDLAKRIVNEAITEIYGSSFDIQGYLEGWVESLNECSDGELLYTMNDVSCQASDNLVYSNAHYYNGRNPLTSSESSELCLEVEMLIDTLIKTLELA